MSGMREDEVDGFEPSLSLANEKRRADQMDTNFKYVFGILEKIHDNLCPHQNGTWQMRCEQALKASDVIRAEQDRIDNNRWICKTL
jgi:hypothetical protein